MCCEIVSNFQVSRITINFDNHCIRLFNVSILNVLSIYFLKSANNFFMLQDISRIGPESPYYNLKFEVEMQYFYSMAFTKSMFYFSFFVSHSSLN